MSEPTNGRIVATMPYTTWLDFRWQILLKLVSIVTEKNMEAAIYASKKLAEAERMVTVEWQDQDPDNRLAIIPFDEWISFRWEIALNVISVMGAESIAVSRDAVKILADAETKVKAEWRQDPP